jgi:hypothetical protein
MGRLASSVILCIGLLQVFCACGAAVDLDMSGDGDAGFVNLDISVAMSDVSGSLTKAADSDAADDNEKMQSLRIVIVRPDMTVEANRRINLKAVLNHEEETFKVAANEQKTIYLFVNEDTEFVSETDNIKRKVVDYDFSGIIVGQPFPGAEIGNLTVRLDSRSAQVAGPLPMSGKHFVDVPGKDHSCRLFVTRAAVKFTFHINNESSEEVGLGGVTLSKMAREEWYVPRALYDEKGNVTDYEVPALEGDNGYYIFRNDFVPYIPLAVGGKVDLSPIYLLEGQYKEGYSMSIFIGGTERHAAVFDNLPELPRNTHVVVNVTIKKDARIVWEADVVPYEVVDLNPGFGK